MKTLRFFIFSTFLILSYSISFTLAAPPEVISFERIENDTIYFKSTTTPIKPFKSGLFDLMYLSVIKNIHGKYPYFLFTGKPCETCSDDSKVFAIRPNGGVTTFVYPGTVIDPNTGNKLLVSRTFYGECLKRHNGKNYGQIIITYHTEKLDRKKIHQHGVLIAEPGEEYLSEELLERNLPPIKQTLALVEKKVCHEIPGRKRNMNPQNINLKVKTASNSWQFIHDFFKI